MGTSTTASRAIGRGARAGLLIALASCGHSGARARAPDDVVALGDVRITVHVSRTASLFHAVDQISAWSPLCHPQYAKWAPAPEDKEAADALHRHAEIRKETGWGGAGIERAFYLEEGAGAPAEEKRILHVLSYRLESKIDRGDAQAKKLDAALRKESRSFTRLAKNVLAFAELPPPAEPIPMAFVPSPGRGVGEGSAEGGVAVVEVPESGAVRATLATVAHELVYALLAPRARELHDAGEACGRGLDETAEGEAIAYAIAPGLFAYDEGAGSLERLRDRTPASTLHGRFVRLAIAIRPRVKEMLDRPRHDALRAVLDATCEAAKDLEWSTADRP